MPLPRRYIKETKLKGKYHKKGPWKVFAVGSLHEERNFLMEVPTVSTAMKTAKRHYMQYPGPDDYHNYIDSIVIVSPTNDMYGCPSVGDYSTKKSTNWWDLGKLDPDYKNIMKKRKMKKYGGQIEYDEEERHRYP